MRSNRRTEGQDQEAMDRAYLAQMRGQEPAPNGADAELEFPDRLSARAFGPSPGAGRAGSAPGTRVAAGPSPQWGSATAPVEAGAGFFSGGYQGGPAGSPAPRSGAPLVPQYTAYPASVAAPPAPPAPADRRELVTCPECGEIAQIDPAHREAGDFCRRCDYPLFWARSLVVLPTGEDTGASLRRLPGTAGRAATASVPCPHCGEPNSPVAQTCLRCGLPMHPVAAPPPPEPEPVYVPAAEVAPEPEPVAEYPSWWILLVVLSVLVIAALVAWAYLW